MRSNQNGSPAHGYRFALSGNLSKDDQEFPILQNFFSQCVNNGVSRAATQFSVQIEALDEKSDESAIQVLKSYARVLCSLTQANLKPTLFDDLDAAKPLLSACPQAPGNACKMILVPDFDTDLACKLTYFAAQQRVELNPAVFVQDRCLTSLAVGVMEGLAEEDRDFQQKTALFLFLTKHLENHEAHLTQVLNDQYVAPFVDAVLPTSFKDLLGYFTDKQAGVSASATNPDEKPESSSYTGQIFSAVSGAADSLRRVLSNDQVALSKRIVHVKDLFFALKDANHEFNLNDWVKRAPKGRTSHHYSDLAGALCADDFSLLLQLPHSLIIDIEKQTLADLERSVVQHSEVPVASVAHGVK